MKSSLRIGLVGAGQNTKVRHLPNLLAIPGVEIAGVVNRSPESSARVAKEWSIPKVYPQWKDLVSDSTIDAVVIGTWPDLHCEVTCAALAAGKHVLCEARMARNVAEAKKMHAAHEAHSKQVAMLVPSPFGLYSAEAVRDLIVNGFIGDLREFVVLGGTDQFFDYSEPLHWRQDVNISGVNTLALGILHETWLRWFPQPRRVMAQTQIFESQRPSPTSSEVVPTTVPDSVQVLAQMEGSARGIYHLSGMQLFGPGYQMHFYGSNGTIKITLGADQDQVQIGRPGDVQLEPYAIPEAMRGTWRAEQEFVAAIRGEAPVRRTDFATGVQYMEFTEAVLTSAAKQQPVELPRP